MLIEHKRFQEIGKPKRSLFYKFPHIKKKYFEFFNNYAKKNYQWVATNCPCKYNNDILNQYSIYRHIPKIFMRKRKKELILEIFLFL